MRFAPWFAAALASNAFALAACGDDGSGGRNGAFSVGSVDVTTNEDTPVSVAIPVTAANANTLTVTIATQPAHGTVTASEGDVTTYTYTPGSNYDGSDQFTATVSDGANTATGTINITVAPVDDAPVAGAAMFNTNIGQPLVIPTSSLLAMDTDVEADTLTIVGVDHALNGAVEMDGSNVTFTPAAGFAGDTTFTYTVSDGHLNSNGTVTVNVGGGSDRPPVAVADSQTTPENTALVIPASALLGNDTDADGDTLIIQSVTNGIHGTVAFDNATSTVTFTPDPNFHGIGGFTYIINDGRGGTAAGTVAVTVTHVNQAPVANADSLTIAENTVGTVNLLANDTDADNDGITITAVTQGAKGSVSFTGSVATYTPAANFTGLDSFTYTISDGNGGTDTGTVTVNVQGVNHAPTAVNDSMTVSENSSGTVNVLANDSDLDSDPLVVTASTPPSSGVVSFTGGVATYTPNANFVGTDSFKYTISDGRGGTAQATVSVNVVAVNRAPVATNDLLSTPENTAGTVNVTANDHDPDGDPLTISNFTQPTHGAVTFAGTVATYTPTHNFSGNDAFSYTITDGKGGTATGIVSVTVSHVNQPPVAVNDTLATTENNLGTVNVASNDTDPDNDTLTIASFTQGSHGSVAFSNTVANYTPATNFSGTDSFTYVISDGHGATAAATVSVTVAPGTGTTNTPPVASNLALSVLQGGTLNGNVSSSVHDADNDPLTYSIATQPSDAPPITINATTGAFTYTPNANFFGTDSFSYRANDGHANSNVATVTITVTHVNHAPVANAATDYIVVGTQGDVTLFLPAFDPDGDPLFASGNGSNLETTAKGGSVAFSATGTSVIYTPPAPGGFGESGDSFTYQVTDGSLTSAIKQITLVPPVCGDGTVANSSNGNGTEQCEDGNQVGGDGCELDCTFTCGDVGGTTPTAVAVDPLTGSCFATYALGGLSYQGAANQCAQFGGHLPTIGDATEQSTVVKALGNDSFSPWLGVNNTTGQGDHNVTGEPLTFTGFGPGGNGGGTPGCVALDPSAPDSQNDWLATTDCSNDGTSTGVMCEFDLYPRQSSFAAPTTASSVVTGDFNNDGLLDIAFLTPTQKTVGVMLNDSAGGFGPTIVTTLDGIPSALAAGDLNGDTKADLAITISAGNTVETLLSNGDGTFGTAASFPTSSDTQADPIGVVIVQSVQSGILVAVANAHADSVSVLTNTGGNLGTFAETFLPNQNGQFSRPNAIAGGVIDNTGHIGFATANGAEGNISVLVPSLSATGYDAFNYVVQGSPSAVAIGQYFGGTGPVVAAGLSDGDLIQLITPDGENGFNGDSEDISTFNVGYTVSALATANIDGEDFLAFGSPDGHAIGLAQLFGERGVSTIGTASHVTGLAIGELAGDGVIDAVITGDAQSSVTVVKGSPEQLASFVPAQTVSSVSQLATTSSLPTAIVAADMFDGGEGRQDIAVLNTQAVNVNGSPTSTIGLLRNINGSISANNGNEIDVGANAFWVTTGDLNNDGSIDLVVTNNSLTGAGGTVTVYLGDSFGDFEASQTLSAGEGANFGSVAIGDVDGDGAQDVIVGALAGDQVFVFRNRFIDNEGNLGFDGSEGFIAGQTPTQIAVGDLNGDGLVEIVTANQGGDSVSVLLNTSDGRGNVSFSNTAGNQPATDAIPTFPAVASPQFVALGLLNADKNLDLVTVDHDANLILVRMGNGNGGFSASTSIPVGISPTSAVIADLNGDGLFDIAVANNKSSNITYVLNQGGGTFGPPITQALGAGAFGIVAADIDGDGRNELCVSDNNASSVEILNHNSAPR